MTESADTRLEPFKELNKRKGVTWEDRVDLIKEQFPSIEQLDWGRLFSQDTTVLGNLINDIIKVEVAEPGRPGKRPTPDKKVAAEKFRQYQNQSFSTFPFWRAFQILQGDRSIRHFARKVDMNRNYVYRLLRGETEPTIEDMEQIAEKMGKSPAYFVEYRAAWICAAVAYKLEGNPETSMAIYAKLRKQLKRSL